MQSIKTAFAFNSDGNSVVEEVRTILSKSELPEDWKSEPWTYFVTEMMTYEMVTRQMKINCVNVWQAYARKWRELEPDLNESKVLPVFAGSYAEGMPNACDLDMIFVATWVESYEYFGKLRDNVNSFPFISDLCHQGYIKLIIPSNTRRFNGFQDYLIKKDGRHYYLSSKGFVRAMKECGTTGYKNHINGPALTEEGVEGFSTDIVHAIKCTHWPSFANDIFQRAHFNGDVEKMKHLSVYAVATGHALSKHKDIEWRLSFTEAEKVLVMNWTDTQYHCYYLLKHFKMIHLKNSDVLCSYFMKTVIFWISDVIHNAEWQPIRLTELLFKSLTLLHIMYMNHYLPNYFIPQNNMIDHKSKDECLILADMIPNKKD
ncbi:cyclic GMP-AMP synthase-like receptor 2 [Mytilus edulis]|uniref:cyclic GMP-AMP synthase-like receptor 2 n=1 Tax=Mytilus edulis TaxID=6550 RepID=UPI0039F07F30